MSGRQRPIRYLEVRDFERLQRYDRPNPPWVRLYGSMLDDFDFQQLSDETKYHAIALILLAARTNNRIPAEIDWISSKIGAKSPINLDELLRVKFLQIAPKYKKKKSRNVSGTENVSRTKRVTRVDRDRAETHTHTEADGARDAPPLRVVSGCGSKFSLEECKRYAEHLHKTGQGIKQPGAYATTIFRSGEADSLIEAFLFPPAQLDLTQCPDCHGSNFIHVDPKDFDKGVRPCKHERLPASATR